MKKGVVNGLQRGKKGTDFSAARKQPTKHKTEKLNVRENMNNCYWGERWGGGARLT